MARRGSGHATLSLQHSGSGASSDGRSQELEKLLNSWDTQSTRSSSNSDSHAHNNNSSSNNNYTGSAPHGADTDAYDAEVMIDELLASTWEPVQVVRKASLVGHGPSAAATATTTGETPSQARSASFKQQTQSMNALQSVLAATIDKLKKHRLVIADRIATLEHENAKASSKFHDGLRNPEVLLNQICVQMEDLEERFTKVSSTAVVIGDRLQTLDQERTRVLETDEMMEALLALNDPASKLAKSNNRLFNTLQDPLQRHDAARVVKKMCVFSTELSSPATAHAVAEIERLSQSIENDLLSEFSDAQDRDDVAAMGKCAASLIEYNDKEKVADRYVWNVMKDRLAKDQHFTTVSSLDPIQDLEGLFSTIRTICRDEFHVIHCVFPASTHNSIRELLIERLFNDPAFGVFSYLDQFLTTRRQSSANPFGESSADDAALAYVQLLCAAYEKTCDLAQAIETMSVAPSRVQTMPLPTTSTIRTKQSVDNDREPETLTTDNDDNDALRLNQERMHTFLSLQLHSLFGGHRQRYFRTELELVQTQLRTVVAGVTFPQQLTAKQKAVATKSKHSAASTAAAHTPSTAASASSSNFERDGLAATASDASTRYYETLLAIADDDAVPAAFALAMTDAVGRCEFILKDSELRAELVTKLFSSFVASYGDEYLGRVAAMASDVLQEPLLTAESARQFFHILEFLLRQIDVFEEQFDTTIAPVLQDAPTQFTICFENKRRCLDKIERAVASGLQLVFTVVEKHVSALLSTTQDKRDFLGTETNLSLASSRACRKCIDYLQPLVTTISRVLIDENRDRFLIALCATFKDVYLHHVQRFRFDPDGACMLLRDVNAYRQIFRSFPHAAIDDAFDVLHEVANVFALPPENLAGFVRDGKLASLPRQTLVDIVKRRWDYKTSADKIGI